MQLGRLGVWCFLDGPAAPVTAAAAKRIESMGYSALWIPETVGRDPLVHASWLLANTSTLQIATGIANLYNREPGVMLSGQKTLAEQSGDRFLLGIGVSHKPLVEGVRGLQYGPPAATMRTYLERMAQSPYMGAGQELKPRTVIAALGPQMLKVARTHCDGAHPYFSSPAHTRMAREILGPDKLLCVEQKIILETDATKARQSARAVAQNYIALPNYRNNWLRMGLSEADFDGGGSDAFVDTTFAWGDLDAIKQRLAEHFEAGASHVCVQTVNPNGPPGEIDWKVLEKLAGWKP